MTGDRARARFERKLNRLLAKEARRLVLQQAEADLAILRVEHEQRKAELDRLMQNSACFQADLATIRAAARAASKPAS